MKWHWDNVTHTGQRGFHADRVYLTENNDGQLVMQCNGPTAVPMPRLDDAVEYRNIAEEATITAKNCDEKTAKYLNDDKISVYSFVDFVKEFEAKGNAKITLEFDDYRVVRALMVFNSKDISTMFHSVKKIELYHQNESGKEEKAVIEKLKFDEENLVSDSGVMNQCASAIAEFDELKCNKIVFTFDEDAEFNISEIYVLGK